ncbi:MAG: LPS-assembly protein LptD [Chlamydiales bacterium]|nr:LPS-assembly protein LptD [Chlamydiales bacterium]
MLQRHFFSLCFGIWSLSAYLLALPLCAEGIEQEVQELKIDLKNPTFTEGVIRTEEGGVITGPGLRIQAKKITYTNRIENGIKVQKILAEGDLMMDYADRAFVGSRLEYDFIHKTGTLWNGKTFTDVWFLGGDRIDLKEDGSLYIYNAFVTTSENQDNTWEITAKKAKLTPDYLLSADNIRFKFFKIPLLWLPSFKSNIKAVTDSPIRYKIVWDKGLGPRITMRYRFFSWRDLNLFFRLDYRIKKGFGGALESEYFSPDGLTTFVTRTYGAHDKSFPYETGPHRYRLQGLYHTQSKDERTQVHFTYDKLSDNRMVGDFKSDDFEINTQKRSELLVYHQRDNLFTRLHVQPRLNSFQSIDQELPLLSMGIRPFQIGSSGIIASNYANGGYLDYVYASEMRNKFHELGLSSSTHSWRLESRNTLHRPFHLGPITFMPAAGFYGEGPSSIPLFQQTSTPTASLEKKLLPKRSPSFIPI